MKKIKILLIMAIMPFYVYSIDVVTVEVTPIANTIGSTLVWNIATINNTQTSIWVCVHYSVSCTYENGVSVAKFIPPSVTNLVQGISTNNVMVSLKPSEYKDAVGKSYLFKFNGSVCDLNEKEFYIPLSKFLIDVELLEGEVSLSPTNNIPIGGKVTASASIRNPYPFTINNVKVEFVAYDALRQNNQWTEESYAFPTIASNALIQASHQFTVYREGKKHVSAFLSADELSLYKIGEFEVGEDPTEEE